MKTEAKRKEIKIRVFWQQFTHARTSLHAQARLCVHKFLPRKPKNKKKKKKKQKKIGQNLKTRILTT